MGRAARRRLSAVLLLLVLASQGCAGIGPLDSLLRPGGTLRLHFGEPLGLDPSRPIDATSWSYLIQIYSGLVRLDNEMDVVPDLAERWETSEDGRTYTFTIRSDARFHDGRSITARDFVFAMERALSTGDGTAGALQYLGDIVGAREVVNGEATSLSGARVIDDHHLSLTIDAPKSQFLAKLTFPMAFALDRSNVESGPDWAERPNGSGPFRLTEWRRNEALVLTRFDDYWSGPALVKTLDFDLTPVPGIVLYEHGEVDVTEISAGDAERISDPSNPLSADLVVTPLLSITYVGMNASTPPFDDPQVRQAFAHATDRERLVRVLYQGHPIGAAGFVPPGLPGFGAEARVLPFDGSRARDLLRGSRYGQEIPEITLSVGPGGGRAGVAIAEMYSRVLGLPIGVEEVDETFYERMRENQVQMFIAGWIGDYPDVENFLDLLFHTGSASNYGDYSNPQLDAILDQARVESDSDRRTQLYQDAEKLILGDAAAIPIYHDVSRALVGPHVTGLVWTPLGILTYQGVEVHERSARSAA